MNVHAMRKHRTLAGFMLLEVLVALLVFSLGVLGLVGLQANAIKQSGQAKYRADAALLADELIGTMWVGNRTPAALQAAYGSTPSAEYAAWLAKVGTTLPGADSYAPTVTVTQVNPVAAGPGTVVLTPSSRVAITMRWKAPGESASDPAHSLVILTQIK